MIEPILHTARIVHGIVTPWTRIKTTRDESTYQLRLKPFLALLESVHDSAVFVDRSFRELNRRCDRRSQPVRILRRRIRARRTRRQIRAAPYVHSRSRLDRPRSSSPAAPAHHRPRYPKVARIHSTTALSRTDAHDYQSAFPAPCSCGFNGRRSVDGCT
ncbi:contractile injection system protein, VgrG/Pvc8 family [Burkholderia sp. MR1-5-21]